MKNTIKTFSAILSLFFIFYGASHAIVYDDFNDEALDFSKWIDYASSDGTVTESGGRIDASLMPTANGQEFHAGIDSTVNLTSNFKIDVDFSLTSWPIDNGVRSAVDVFSAHNDAGHFHIERSASSPGENFPERYVMSANELPLVSVETNDTSGKFRLMRVANPFLGNTLVGSFQHQNGVWQELATIPLFDVGMTGYEALGASLNTWSHDSVFNPAGQAVTVSFDNFMIDGEMSVNEQALDVLADQNGNGSSELVLLGFSGKSDLRSFIYDSKTNALLSSINLPDNFYPYSLEIMPDIDASGYQEIVIFGRDSNGYILGIIYDSLTGAWINTVTFPSDLDVEGGGVIGDLNGNNSAELMLLGRRSSGFNVALMYDSVSGEWVNTIILPTDFKINDVEVVSDINGNGSHEIVIIGIRASGYRMAVLYDTETRSWINTIVLPTDLDIQFTEIVNDLNGNSRPEIMVTGRRANGYLVTLLYDTVTSNWINTIILPTSMSLIDVQLTEDTNGNGRPEVIAIGRHGTGYLLGILYDTTTRAWVNTIILPTDLEAAEMVILPDVNGNNIDEISVLGVYSSSSSNQILMVSYDTQSTGWINTIALKYTATGFTMSELAGKTYQMHDPVHSCTDTGTFNTDGTLLTPDGSLANYVITDGSIVIENAITISPINRENSTIQAYFKSYYPEDYVVETAWTGVDFSTLGNSAAALKDWFITNGFWPDTTITSDGRVIVASAPVEGRWVIIDNVFYFTYPGPTNMCPDHKAYKLVNDVLMYATDANWNGVFTMEEI